MIYDFLVVAGQVATLFVLMGVGFVVTKAGKLSEQTTSQMSFLLLYVIAPCLTIESMEVVLTHELLVNLGKAALAFILTYLIFIPLSMPFFPSRDSDTRPVLRFGLIFANTGFMGFPLVEAVVGSEALIYAAASTVVFTILAVELRHRPHGWKGQPQERCWSTRAPSPCSSAWCCCLPDCVRPHL